MVTEAAARDDSEAPINVSELTKRQGSVDIVRDLSFCVPRHRILGLLGPPGAGKTTVLRMLLGLVEPTSGTATFGGRPYRDLLDPTRHVGMVLDAAGPDTVDAAVARHPRVLILDAPTVGLDAAGIDLLGITLRSFAQTQDAVLLTSRSMADIAALVDEVVILRAGRAVLCTSITDLRASAARTRALQVHTPQPGPLSLALALAGYGSLHVGPHLLHVHDIVEDDLRRIVHDARVPIDGVVRGEPDLDLVYARLTS